MQSEREGSLMRGESGAAGEESAGEAGGTNRQSQRMSNKACVTKTETHTHTDQEQVKKIGSGLDLRVSAILKVLWQPQGPR